MQSRGTARALGPLVAMAAIAALFAPAARANYFVEGVVAGVNPDNGVVQLNANNGATQTYLAVDPQTRVEAVVAGSLSDLQIQMPIRFVVRGRVQPGAREVPVMRIRILDGGMVPRIGAPDGGYIANYVEGWVVQLSPVLQIETPGGITVTGDLDNNLQIAKPVPASPSDIQSGQYMQAVLRNTGGGPPAKGIEVWAWEIKPN
jgi:hypothetical protein